MQAGGDGSCMHSLSAAAILGAVNRGTVGNHCGACYCNAGCSGCSCCTPGSAAAGGCGGVDLWAWSASTRLDLVLCALLSPRGGGCAPCWSCGAPRAVAVVPPPEVLESAWGCLPKVVFAGSSAVPFGFGGLSEAAAAGGGALLSFVPLSTEEAGGLDASPLPLGGSFAALPLD